jgi:hypothetical protein
MTRMNRSSSSWFLFGSMLVIATILARTPANASNEIDQQQQREETTHKHIRRTNITQAIDRTHHIESIELSSRSDEKEFHLDAFSGDMERADEFAQVNGLIDSPTQRHLLAFTGTWSCTGYGSCGYYPACNQNRTCTCGGGTCDPALKPAASQACACQYTYTFGYGDWSTCTVSCGPGTQSRSASCFRSDNAIVANVNCGTPVLNQNCNNGQCTTARMRASDMW